MSAQPRSSWPPILTALSIWFVHFMVCWAAAEIWPKSWPANAVAWTATALALLSLGVHMGWLRARHGAGAVSGWAYRFAQGAVALATVAVLFSALPSLVFLP